MTTAEFKKDGNSAAVSLLSATAGRTLDLGTSPVSAAALPTGYDFVSLHHTGVEAHLKLGGSGVVAGTADGEWDIYLAGGRVDIPVRDGQTHVIGVGDGTVKIMGRY